MANTFFRFKQFTIQQDACAMKVSTDACLFGAWTAEYFPSNAQHVLDIGTGTGLLSLMNAQKNKSSTFHAIEIDKPAAMQAATNFEQSPWKNNFKIYHNSIQAFAEQNIQPYDVIISNPPFFQNDLKSNNEKRNLALHSEALSLEELLTIASKLLKDNGVFFLLMPFHRNTETKLIGRQVGLHVEEEIHVKQTPTHTFFRTMFRFTKTTATTKTSEIVIQHNNTYTTDFIELLKDYYLYL
ncbi:MAG: methyltransferase [Bacteroidota bacterium]|nr:methyltransferase [Bacteroidota bacterium]